MTVRWKPVPDYEGIYEVSDAGQVRSVARRDRRGCPVAERILRTRSTPKGYVQVDLNRDGVRRTTYVHALVLAAFVGPRPEGQEACHGDTNPKNNALRNLRWDTSRENNLDIVRAGAHNNASKTHCPRNHEYTPENTRLQIRANGQARKCRTCERAAALTAITKGTK